MMMPSRHHLRGPHGRGLLNEASLVSASPSGAPEHFQGRWAASAHLPADEPSIRLALTLAESVAYDAGDRARAAALAQAVVDPADRHATITFTLGYGAGSRELALDALRSYLGQSARDLDNRNWARCAEIMRAISAAAR
jgi:hypothetical protein